MTRIELQVTDSGHMVRRGYDVSNIKDPHRCYLKELFCVNRSNPLLSQFVYVSIATILQTSFTDI